MKNNSRKSSAKITDYFTLKFYEKIPFCTYPLFLLVLVPMFLTPATESELLSDRVIILAFVIALITIGASFLIIHYKRKGEIIGITVVTKEKEADVTIERYSEKDHENSFDLETEDEKDDDKKEKEIIDKTIEEIKQLESKLKNEQTKTSIIKKLDLAREEIEKIIEIRADEGNKKVTTKILSVLYGLVAALAITNALDFFMDDQTGFSLPYGITDVDFTTIDSIVEIGYLIISQEFILLISFFVIGTFFYHCGLAFFSDQAAAMMHTKPPRPTAEIVLSGVILFTQGIFLYFAAGSIGSILQFSLWMFFLMVADVAWVLLNSDYLKRGYAQWIHFDIIMIIFFVVFLQYGANVALAHYHYLIVFGVILCRIILDYKLSWQFFTKFSITE